ncbi:MAG: CPBP family intramembrane metalloprotease [Bacteroidetes bacterium]|jgi:membrane protease YdiL (CAAX protease family)|nr:CPBP family intramembrane metalloprotease [Bacteroidota bacterium]
MNQPQPDEPVIEGRKLIIVSLLSGLVWLLLANLIIYYVQETKLAELFFAGYHFLIQIGVGLISGVIFGFAGLGLIRLQTFKRILNEYAIIRQVKQMDLSVKEIVYVSLIAGISEEILFRGAIQPVIGIWWTSFLFIGIHGYIRLKTIPHILYSLFTFALSTMLGALFIYIGLISAMAAHFIYDVVVLYGIKHVSEPEELPDDNVPENRAG